jgi:multidrug efflux system membrane fusion protein
MHLKIKNVISHKLTFLALVALIMSCSGKKEEVKEVLRPVIASEVDYLNYVDKRSFTGTSKANEVINLSFRNSGIITYFNLKLGQEVKRGDLLARLDNVQAKLNYETALSNMNSSASTVSTAKLNLDRVRALYEKGSSSLSDYENAKNSYLTAKGSYEASQRSVDIQQEQITYGYLYAPTNGRISVVEAEINENVSAGQLIGVLNADGQKEVLVGIPESVINLVELDQEVDLNFSTLDAGQFKGKVSEVSPAIDPNTATYPVKIIVEGSTESVRSGMSTSVIFDFTKEESSNILGVPSMAVGEDQNGNYVLKLVKIEDGAFKVVKQKVSIGATHSYGIEIQSGLKKGDLVVTAGLQTLVDGQRVVLKDN